MFERFTERARAAIALAQEEARGLDHRSVGTEHLLLGLLRQDQGAAAQALQASGLWLDKARTVVVAVHTDAEETDGQIPFTPGAKRVLERSLREAVRLSHNYVGTEHLLLGLLREPEATGYRALVDMGADPTEVRAVLLELIELRPERRHLPHDPELVALLGRATDAALEEGADRVELRHLRQAMEGS
jgi:ATP-dependent Clp protease ATP-binding subunit ClpC